MKISFKNTFAFIVFFGSLNVQAAECVASYYYQCKPAAGLGLYEAPAVMWKHKVNCSTYAVLSTTVVNNPNPKCVADTTRLESAYTTNHSCSELGWRNQILTRGIFSVQYYTLARGAYIRNECVNGAPARYDFSY